LFPSRDFTPAGAQDGARQHRHTAAKNEPPSLPIFRRSGGSHALFGAVTQFEKGWDRGHGLAS
jgi:hypothetical protein